MREITAGDYDWRVKKEGAQFQIDHFYRPVDSAQKRRIDIVMRHAAPRPGHVILDLGCGVGTFAYHCACAGARAFGVDYSSESLRMGRALCKEFGRGDMVSFAAGTAQKLPFKSVSFDTIIAADFIEHTTPQEKIAVLEQVNVLLKPGGKCVIFTPNKIREHISALYWRARSWITGEAVPVAELHFGLISKRGFEKLLRMQGYAFTHHYHDVTRPALARIPLIRYFLALNLLWVIRPGTGSGGALCAE